MVRARDLEPLRGSRMFNARLLSSSLPSSNRCAPSGRGVDLSHSPSHGSLDRRIAVYSVSPFLASSHRVISLTIRVRCEMAVKSNPTSMKESVKESLFSVKALRFRGYGRDTMPDTRNSQPGDHRGCGSTAGDGHSWETARNYARSRGCGRLSPR